MNAAARENVEIKDDLTYMYSQTDYQSCGSSSMEQRQTNQDILTQQKQLEHV